MQAFGLNERLFEPGTGGVVSSCKFATGNGLIPTVGAFLNIFHHQREKLSGLVIERFAFIYRI